MLSVSVTVSSGAYRITAKFVCEWCLESVRSHRTASNLSIDACSLNNGGTSSAR
jgi:hypothetical protein